MTTTSNVPQDVPQEKRTEATTYPGPTYSQLVSLLRSGRRLPAADIDAALAAAGRSAGELISDLLAGGPRKGETCPQCGKALLRARSSSRSGDYATQYLECTACGFAAKAIVPAATIPRRRNVVCNLQKKRPVPSGRRRSASPE